MSPRRVDGWAPIADYGLLSNGHTVAMVATDGQIDWWPLPALDDAPAFAAILDPINGGHVEMRPVDDFTVTRRYVGESNVLETTFRTSTGTARLTDALTIGRAGVPLPWGELVRRVECVDGQVAMRWAVHPGTRFGTTDPWTQQRGGDIVVHCGDQHLAVRSFDVGEPIVAERQVSGTFSTSAATSGLLAVTASDDAPIYLPGRVALESRLDDTLRNWHQWSAAMTYDGRWSQAVRRSGLVLKLLLHTPTGAIAAAATTSLPERIGGDKNWDYRYMWIRDTSYAVDACIQLGLEEEVQGAIVALLRSVRSTLPGLSVFYRLNGEPPSSEHELDAPGYRDSRPVRAGNGAVSQTQLGTFGDLFDSLWRYVQDGHLLDPATAQMLAELADRCCETWRSEDSGIWELYEPRHYTISKIGCWVALDRVVQLAEHGHVPADHADRWRDERVAIKAWVDEHCWSDAKCSYTFFAGTERARCGRPVGRDEWVRSRRTASRHRRGRAARALGRTADLPIQRHVPGRGRVSRVQLLDGFSPGCP